MPDDGQNRPDLVVRQQAQAARAQGLLQRGPVPGTGEAVQRELVLAPGAVPGGGGSEELRPPALGRKRFGPLAQKSLEEVVEREMPLSPAQVRAHEEIDAGEFAQHVRHGRVHQVRDQPGGHDRQQPEHGETPLRLAGKAAQQRLPGKERVQAVLAAGLPQPGVIGRVVAQEAQARRPSFGGLQEGVDHGGIDRHPVVPVVQGRDLLAAEGQKIVVDDEAVLAGEEGLPPVQHRVAGHQDEADMSAGGRRQALQQQARQGFPELVGVVEDEDERRAGIELIGQEHGGLFRHLGGRHLQPQQAAQLFQALPRDALAGGAQHLGVQDRGVAVPFLAGHPEKRPPSGGLELRNQGRLPLPRPGFDQEHADGGLVQKTAMPEGFKAGKKVHGRP